MHCFVSKFSNWIGWLETSPLSTDAKDRLGSEMSKFGGKAKGGSGEVNIFQIFAQSGVSPTLHLSLAKEK